MIAMLPPSRFADSLRGVDPKSGDPVSGDPMSGDPRFLDGASGAMRDEPAPRSPATLLPWTIKICLTLGLIAVGATHYVSRAVDVGALRQRMARAAPVDPETTGSIGGAAARVTLDPCTVYGFRR